MAPLGVWLLPRPEQMPSPALLQQLAVPEQALLRAQSFQSATRRRDFLWARALLCAALHAIDAAATLVERPPLAPAIASDAPWCASISHTRTWIGVTIAREPAALDLEVMRPERVRKELFERVFGAELWRAAQREDAVGFFYRAWGVYECAVKLDGTFCRSADAFWVQSRAGGRLPQAHHRLASNTLLTVVGADADSARLHFVRTDAALSELIIEPAPTAPQS